MAFIIKPWQRFVVIQCFGGLLLALLVYFEQPLLLCIVISAGCSSLIAKRYHAESWWIWIHLAFLPAVFFALQLALPSYVYFLAFIVTWVVFGQIAKSRVPLFLSEKEALTLLAANVGQNARFLDIGAGTGRVLAYLSQVRPDIQLHGVELACLPWLYGRITLGRQVDWHRGDYQNIDFSQFDCIYAYLSPAVMSEVWEKAQQEMKPGSRLISNSFAIDGQTPIEVLPLNDWKNGKLLIWQM